MDRSASRLGFPTRDPIVRGATLLLLGVLVLAACGQLPNVRGSDPRGAVDLADPFNGNGVDAENGFEDLDPSGDPIDPGDPGAPGDPQDPQAGPATPGQQQQDGPRQVRGQDRTGVTDSVIRLGSHAPVTGAAPLPARSFEQASDLYWRWIIEVQNQRVLGRSKVELEFADDRYQPSSAVQVCRQLAQRTFLLAGAGGTDQIQACARFANSARVPYASAGVTERGLEGLEWYYAFSMTYRAQGALLAEYVRSLRGRTVAGRSFGQNPRVAAIITNTPNFDDAVTGWEQGVQRQGLNYYRTMRHPRGDTSWYNTFARELNNADVDIVYILTAPVDYIRFAQQARQQGYTPQFVGVGISMGLNAVLGSGCNHVDGGIFFSPFPGLDWARENEPQFFQAAQRFNTPRDDLAFAIWGQAKSLHEMFKRYGQTYGNDLTREDFNDLLQTQRNIRGGVFPPVSYSPQSRFGANQVHVIRANCQTSEHETLHTFRNGF